MKALNVAIEAKETELKTLEGSRNELIQKLVDLTCSDCESNDISELGSTLELQEVDQAIVNISREVRVLKSVSSSESHEEAIVKINDYLNAGYKDCSRDSYLQARNNYVDVINSRDTYKITNFADHSHVRLLYKSYKQVSEFEDLMIKLKSELQSI